MLPSSNPPAGKKAASPGKAENLPDAERCRLFFLAFHGMNENLTLLQNYVEVALARVKDSALPWDMEAALYLKKAKKLLGECGPLIASLQDEGKKR